MRKALFLTIIMMFMMPQHASAQETAVDPKVVMYILRTTPPDELIRYYFRDTPDVKRMLAIAMRESNMRCDADNPRSSAAGLFQTIGIHRARAERLGLSWTNIEGPDCLDDVLLAKAIYDDSGLAPWAL